MSISNRRNAILAFLFFTFSVFACCGKSDDKSVKQGSPESGGSKNQIRRDTLPVELSTDISEYKDLLNQKKFSEGLKKIKVLIPKLEVFVGANPNNSEGYLELSGVYIIFMFVGTNYLEPGTQKLQVLAESVQKDYIVKARQALERFQTLAEINDPRRDASNELCKWLEDIESKTTRGQ